MHVQDSLVLTKGGISGRIGVIISDDEKPAERLRKKGCEKEDDDEVKKTTSFLLSTARSWFSC